MSPGPLSRNKTFCIVKADLGSEFRAADVLTPAPGQGEGWGGGRNLAGAVPAFDPHPGLSCRPRRARGSTRRPECWVHRIQARPATAPAWGKVQFPPACAPATDRAVRFFANAAARQGCGVLKRNEAFRIAKA